MYPEQYDDRIPRGYSRFNGSDSSSPYRKRSRMDGDDNNDAAKRMARPTTLSNAAMEASRFEPSTVDNNEPFPRLRLLQQQQYPSYHHESSTVPQREQQLQQRRQELEDDALILASLSARTSTNNNNSSNLGLYRPSLYDTSPTAALLLQQQHQHQSNTRQFHPDSLLAPSHYDEYTSTQTAGTSATLDQLLSQAQWREEMLQHELLLRQQESRVQLLREEQILRQHHQQQRSWNGDTIDSSIRTTSRAPSESRLYPSHSTTTTHNSRSGEDPYSRGAARQQAPAATGASPSLRSIPTSPHGQTASAASFPCDAEDKNSAIPALNQGVSLLLPIDRDFLSEFQLLIRESLEVFRAPATPVNNRKKGGGPTPGRVGLRCKYCATCTTKSRGAVYFPGKLDRMYQAAQNMAANHFLGPTCCPSLPAAVQAQFAAARKKQEQSIQRRGGKSYWVETCRCMGLGEREGQKGVWWEAAATATQDEQTSATTTSMAERAAPSPDGQQSSCSTTTTTSS